MLAHTNVTHPELKRILQREWSEYRRRHGRLSLREAADKMGMKSPSAFHSWLRGERTPKNKNIKTLVDFFRETESERKKLDDEIKSAVSAPPVAAQSDPLDVLVSGLRKLAVGVIEYEPFSGQPSDFFNYVFDRFAAFANLTQISSPAEQVTLDVAQQRLLAGTLDVALGIMQTPDRALPLKFFRSPIRIPVNAVMLEDSGGRISKEDVRNALSKRVMEGNRARIISPIVNDKEVGGLHVRNYLSMSSPQGYRAVGYDVNQYVEAMLELNELRDGPVGPVPVVVADELMCVRVIRKINGMTSSSKGGNKGAGNLKLLFDSNGHQDKGPLLPRYRLGFAVNRNHHKWIDYLDEAFEIFLDSNAELVAGYYSELYWQINDEFKKASLMENGQDPGGDWLGLKVKPNSETVSPWGEIIRQARRTTTEAAVRRAP